MMNAKRVSNNVLISTNDVCMLAPMSSTNFLPTLSGEDKEALFFSRQFPLKTGLTRYSMKLPHFIRGRRNC